MHGLGAGAELPIPEEIFEFGEGAGELNGEAGGAGEGLERLCPAGVRGEDTLRNGGAGLDGLGDDAADGGGPAFAGRAEVEGIGVTGAGLDGGDDVEDGGAPGGGIDFTG